MSITFEKKFPNLPIFLLIAPTASGKTDTAIQLANNCDLEIVNADAYQFFRMMDIGTAKPTTRERAQAPHHLFDICNPDQPYSAHQFSADARKAVFDIFSRGKIPLFVGGSGFYARAFLTKDSDLPKGTHEIDDYEHAYQTIIEKDPEIANQLHPNDSYRISRASFLLEQNIIPSQAWASEKEQKIVNPHHILSINIEREHLYERIDQRVLQMIEQGLIQETSDILDKFPNAQKRLSKTIGYQQVLQYQNGDIDESEMVALIQQKTRNYAKRQLTWIRNQLEPKIAHFENAIDEFSCYIRDLTL